MNADNTSLPLHPALGEFRLKSRSLRNRLCLAPMTRVSAEADGTPTPQMLAYYQAFANGGFGLLISEGVYPGETFGQGYANQPGMANGQHQQGWQPIVEAVHGAGAVFVLQLMHAGAISQHLSQTIAPSAVRPKGGMMPGYGGSGPYPIPRAMTPDDIEGVKNDFVQAALRAQSAGFDGVEVHSANGYLLDQFITTYTNHREDQYGGSIANRIRLPAEIVAAVKAAVSSEFIVGIRLSQTKVNDGAYRWPEGRLEGEILFRSLAAAGADYLHLASEVKDWPAKEMTEAGGISITRLARAVTGLPVIANGGMHDPERSRMVLAEAHADLVSLARGAMANPGYPQQLAEGHPLLAFEGGMIYPRATISNTQQWFAARGLSCR